MKTIAIPFNFNSTGATNSVTTTKKVVEQQILDILATSRSERVMVPNYGASIRNLLFEEQDPLIFAEFRMDAVNTLNDYLGIGRVTDLSVDLPNDNFYGTSTDVTIRVSVKYIVPPYDVSVLTFSINNNAISIYGGANNG